LFPPRFATDGNRYHPPSQSKEAAFGFARCGQDNYEEAKPAEDVAPSLSRSRAGLDAIMGYVGAIAGLTKMTVPGSCA